MAAVAAAAVAVVVVVAAVAAVSPVVALLRHLGSALVFHLRHRHGAPPVVGHVGGAPVAVLLPPPPRLLLMRGDTLMVAVTVAVAQHPGLARVQRLPLVMVVVVVVVPALAWAQVLVWVSPRQAKQVSSARLMLLAGLFTET